MRIILSPAKKMKYDESAGVDYQELPEFIEDAEIIKTWLKSKSFDELKKLWVCNDAIAEENVKRIERMDLHSMLTPAILSYDGIAYQYMAPTVFETSMLDYVQRNLRILSGFYGVLRPMDGVTPYRLEMQAKAKINGTKNLYDYWGSRLYDSIRDDSGIIINLASKEYSKCIEKYLQPDDTYISCTFAEEEKGKLVQKGVYCKMARGEMVRYLAERQIENPIDMKSFDRLGYVFHEELSNGMEYVFLREPEIKGEW